MTAELERPSDCPTWAEGEPHRILTGTAPVKVPLAKLAAHPVVPLGHLPVSVGLEPTLTAEVSADGDVTIDAQ
ncbi:hypothetical protein ACGF13_29355 [Kitasatospora sp. NPDC048286]|uniref:hypothetical protein n=1 Tax=Kitasatospora sp. NPDC048286 TaxID=3364047 RepID=UPI00371BA34E